MARNGLMTCRGFRLRTSGHDGQHDDGQLAQAVPAEVLDQAGGTKDVWTGGRACTGGVCRVAHACHLPRYVRLGRCRIVHCGIQREVDL